MSLSNIIGKSIFNPNEVAQYDLTVNSITCNSINGPISVDSGLTLRQVDNNGQTISSGGLATTVLFPNLFTSDSGLSYSSGVFTANVTGFYNICYSVAFSASATGSREAYITLSPSNVRYANNWVQAVADGTSPTVVNGSFNIYLVASTQFSIIAYQNSGTSLSLQGSSGTNGVITNMLATRFGFAVGN